MSDPADTCVILIFVNVAPMRARCTRPAYAFLPQVPYLTIARHLAYSRRETGPRPQDCSFGRSVPMPLHSVPITRPHFLINTLPGFLIESRLSPGHSCFLAMHMPCPMPPCNHRRLHCFSTFDVNLPPACLHLMPQSIFSCNYSIPQWPCTCPLHVQRPARQSCLTRDEGGWTLATP